MTENEARTQLRRMLSTLTAGSVLHLLAELFEADAEAAQRVGDDLTAERCENVSATLAVVGLGIDAVLLAATPRAVVHVDEAHELDKEYQTAIYLALDQKKVLLSTRSNRGPQAIPLADFTLLLSTTDEYCLLQPLRDRMRLSLRLQYYADDELVEVARRRADVLGWPVAAEVLPDIARRARGTPRIALRLLQACRRVCRAEGADRITEDHLRRACDLEGTDAIGLGPTDQQYLGVLAAGPTRLNVIASRLGLPTRTVAEVVEPFLIRAGLACKDDQGRRELTAEGRQHLLAQHRPEAV